MSITETPTSDSGVVMGFGVPINPVLGIRPAISSVVKRAMLRA